MSTCGHSYTIDDSERTCQRPVYDDCDRCVFHLTPATRHDAGVSSPTLRDTFLADIEANDPSRREYADITLTDLDLSSLIVDGHDVGHITFLDVTIEGTIDFSGSILRHPIEMIDCEIARLDTTATSFEMDVTVDGTTFGAPSGASTCFRARRGSFEWSLQISDTRFEGNVAFPVCDVGGWLDFDGPSRDTLILVTRLQNRPSPLDSGRPASTDPGPRC